MKAAQRGIAMRIGLVIAALAAAVCGPDMLAANRRDRALARLREGMSFTDAMTVLVSLTNHDGHTERFHTACNAARRTNAPHTVEVNFSSAFSLNYLIQVDVRPDCTIATPQSGAW